MASWNRQQKNLKMQNIMSQFKEIQEQIENII